MKILIGLINGMIAASTPILLAALVFGGLMGYRAGLQFGWARAVVAACRAATSGSRGR